MPKGVYAREPKTLVDEHGRVCTGCGEYKNWDGYHQSSNPNALKGRAARCRECANKALRERSHAANLRYSHNLSTQRYDAMLAAQGGGCAICGGTNSGGGRLVVDHNHNCCSEKKTCGNCIRGLLCRGCNAGLGHIEGPKYQAMIAYLERWHE